MRHAVKLILNARCMGRDTFTYVYTLSVYCFDYVKMIHSSCLFFPLKICCGPSEMTNFQSKEIQGPVLRKATSQDVYFSKLHYLTSC